MSICAAVSADAEQPARRRRGLDRGRLWCQEALLPPYLPDGRCGSNGETARGNSNRWCGRADLANRGAPSVEYGDNDRSGDRRPVSWMARQRADTASAGDQVLGWRGGTAARSDLAPDSVCMDGWIRGSCTTPKLNFPRKSRTDRQQWVRRMRTEVVNDGWNGNRAMGRRAFIGLTAHERRHSVDVAVGGGV